MECYLTLFFRSTDSTHSEVGELAAGARLSKDLAIADGDLDGARSSFPGILTATATASSSRVGSVALDSGRAVGVLLDGRADDGAHRVVHHRTQNSGLGLFETLWRVVLGERGRRGHDFARRRRLLHALEGGLGARGSYGSNRDDLSDRKRERQSSASRPSPTDSRVASPWSPSSWFA